MYQLNLHGKRLTLQTVNDGFDLVYDGSMFSLLWEQAKRKNAFTWENKNSKHNPFAVHDFGSTVDRVVAPTTREQGRSAALGLSVIDREEKEERKNQNVSENPQRQAAIEELEKEKKQIYGELKSSFGEAEARQLISQFMVSLVRAPDLFNLERALCQKNGRNQQTLSRYEVCC
jgi:uncharacterized protein (UPF0335 family)